MASESLFRRCDGCKKDFLVTEVACPHCGKKARKLGRKTSAIFAVVIIILIIVSFGQGSNHKQYSEGGKNPTLGKTASLSQHERIKDDLDLQYSWAKSGFGSIMEANFVITNNSKFDIKDVQIRCEHYASSGTKIDSNDRTIYEVIKQGSSERYLNFNMGFIADQVRESNCKINKFSFV